jgi:hypothetical protein
MLPPQPAQWISIAGNIFSICGLAGVINAQRDLVTAYFAWSAVQMVPAPGRARLCSAAGCSTA